MNGAERRQGPVNDDGVGLLATAWGRLAGIPGSRVGRWLVVAVWVVLAVAAVPLAGRLPAVQKSGGAAFLPRGAESTEVYDLRGRFEGGRDLPAVVVYAREGGAITAADREKVGQDRRKLADVAGDAREVGQPVGEAVPSRDGRTLVFSVPLPPGGDAGTLAKKVGEVRRIAGEDAPEGLTVKVTGPAATTADQALEGVDTTLLLATIAVVTLLLLLTYRSPSLWVLPLLSVGVASQLASAVVYLLARYAGLTVDVQSVSILPVLVFGAGTDYALLLISRYREELHRHESRHEAMGVALRRAGPAIAASAATVAVCLLCLLAADLNSNRTLGVVGAIGIFCALLALTTLLPALLSIFGRPVFWPLVPRHGSPARREGTAWARVGGSVARGPRVAWICTAVVLGVLVFGLSGTKIGLTTEQIFRGTPESVVGQELLAKHYPDGTSNPTVIVANAAAEKKISDAVENISGVSQVMPGVESRSAGSLVQIPVILDHPPDGVAAERTVERLREEVHAIGGADAIVGGATATGLDIKDAAAHDREAVIPLVLAVVFVVLALLLRALVAPLVLVATVVLSFFAALGASNIVFKEVLGFEALDSSLILFGFVFLVALGIDYNIFLMTRIREEAEKASHRSGVLRGLAATGGVITSAGLVLAATFSVLAVLPLVIFAQIGFLVAFGILLDTFVVRSLLVPALALDLGAGIWWPSKLARRAPQEDKYRVAPAPTGPEKGTTSGGGRGDE